MARPIVIVDHDAAWAAHFEKLREPLWQAVHDIALRIEHVGSTSVPGLAAKAVIDLVVVVPSTVEVPLASARICSLGYEDVGDLGIPDRTAFRYANHPLPHHLYVCPAGSPALANHLAFRDRLRARPDIATEYAGLKRALAQSFPNDGNAYSRAKTGFVIGVLREVGFSEAALAAIEDANRDPQP
jgi:GrpB-like predicted nucleotidyltransferase (UPF0157 family)